MLLCTAKNRLDCFSGTTFSGYAVEQDQLKIAEVGDSIDLSCFSTRDMKTTIVWMKQNPGEKPVQIATSYQHQAGTFYNGFDHSGRFKTQAGPGSFNLTISSLEPSDTATYYCANIFIYDITFGEGTVLVVKDASLTKHTVHQLPAVHPGDSVTLQCSVLTESCSGDHSVYWFRHGSGESHPGIIYTHGNRSDECEKSSETDSPTQSCVYKLPKRKLSLSDAGTYYCAVAACGQILFGNGTELNVTAFNVLHYVVQELLINYSLFMQDACDEDLDFAALGLSNKPMSSRHNRQQQKFNDTEVYSKVIYRQQS
uniref:Ig-like domain-containing protein n=1 Tax=Pygocentrus nattereri TaxID=42514 RepID=A0A3B4C3F3_PYGNA